ncbi:hypothetical protein [Arthrobacter sp. B1805]|uniref:hypothetical protein n=1 Tax=Arthrobacter sp. B1805 TaxID=2058892 RepID=UPI000CE39C71|nr:hypothetical protein [Arthrobacter sp. B1805]
MNGRRAATPARGREAAVAASPPSLPRSSILGWSVLLAAALGLLAVVVGWFLSADARAYSGPAQVVESSHHKLCDVEVQFPDGFHHTYSFRADSEECATYIPGASIEITRGTVARPAG